MISLKNFLILFAFFLYSSSLFAGNLSYNSLFSSSNSNQSNHENVKDAQSQRENLDNLIEVLKDSAQREVLIKALEDAKLTSHKVDKKAKVEVNNTTINKLERIDNYTRNTLYNIKKAIIDLHLYDYSLSKFSLFQQEIKTIYDKNIVNLLLWSITLLLSIVVQLFLEKIFFILESKPYKFYQKPLAYNTYNSIAYIYGKIINSILIILPPICAFAIIAGVFIFLHEIQFLDELIKLLGLFALFRILNNFVNNIFYKISYKSLLVFKKHILFAMYSFYIFLVLHDLLVTANSSILIPINLIIFIVFFVILFFKIRKHAVQTVYKLLYPHEEQYILLWSNIKNYYIMLIAVIIFTINYSRFILDYSSSVDFFVKFLITLFQVLVVYMFQRLLFFLFKHFIIKKTENDLYLLSTMQIELKDSYKILNTKALWNYFEILIRVGFFIFYLYLIDNIWALDIIIHLKNILNTRIIDTCINIFIGLSSLLLFTLILLITLQYFLIRKSKIDDVVVKKYLTLFILCRNPYKIIFIMIFIIIILSTLGISVTTLLASTGLITLVFAFGSKDILQNLFNGMVFLMEDSFALNDFIEINGKSGNVENISMAYLRLRDIDGKLHMIPFKTINIITNYTKFYSYAFIEVGISYDSDIEKAKVILNQIYSELCNNPEYKNLIMSPLIMTGVVALDDFSVKIRCKIQTIANEFLTIKAIFLQKIKEEFANNGIEIPFPYRTIVYKDKTIAKSSVKKVKNAKSKASKS